MGSGSKGSFLARLAAALLALLVAAGVILWLFGFALEARYWGWRMPVLRQTPVPVRDPSVTESAGRKIAFCGCAYEFPWSDVNDAKTKSGVNSTILFFDSGLVVISKCEPPREFVDGVLSSFKVKAASFRQAYGDSVMDSDYALWTRLLQTTPDSMTVDTSQRQQGAIMALLVLKAMAMPPADSGIFAIHAHEFNGFQYRDPQAKPKSVLMNLYADDRGLEFQFFLNYNGASVHVSQADLNRIVRTIHKVGPYVPLKQVSTSVPAK